MDTNDYFVMQLDTTYYRKDASTAVREILRSVSGSTGQYLQRTSSGINWATISGGGSGWNSWSDVPRPSTNLPGTYSDPPPSSNLSSDDHLAVWDASAGVWKYASLVWATWTSIIRQFRSPNYDSTPGDNDKFVYYTNNAPRWMNWSDFPSGGDGGSGWTSWAQVPVPTGSISTPATNDRIPIYDVSAGDWDYLLVSSIPSGGGTSFNPGTTTIAVDNNDYFVMQLDGTYYRKDADTAISNILRLFSGSTGQYLQRTSSGIGWATVSGGGGGSGWNAWSDVPRPSSLNSSPASGDYFPIYDVSSGVWDYTRWSDLPSSGGGGGASTWLALTDTPNTWPNQVLYQSLGTITLTLSTKNLNIPSYGSDNWHFTVSGSLPNAFQTSGNNPGTVQGTLRRPISGDVTIAYTNTSGEGPLPTSPAGAYAVLRIGSNNYQSTRLQVSGGDGHGTNYVDTVTGFSGWSSSSMGNVGLRFSASNANWNTIPVGGVISIEFRVPVSASTQRKIPAWDPSISTVALNWIDVPDGASFYDSIPRDVTSFSGSPGISTLSARGDHIHGGANGGGSGSNYYVTRINHTLSGNTLTTTLTRSGLGSISDSQVLPSGGGGGGSGWSAWSDVPRPSSLNASPATGDYFPIYDVSAGVWDYVPWSSIPTGSGGSSGWDSWSDVPIPFANNPAPATNDYVPIYDVSAGSWDYLLVSNFPGGGTVGWDSWSDVPRPSSLNSSPESGDYFPIYDVSSATWDYVRWSDLPSSGGGGGWNWPTGIVFASGITTGTDLAIETSAGTYNQIKVSDFIYGGLTTLSLNTSTSETILDADDEILIRRDGAWNRIRLSNFIRSILYNAINNDPDDVVGTARLTYDKGANQLVWGA